VLNKSVATMVFAAAFAFASMSPVMAAKHAKAIKTKMTGACAQQSGRCVSDCDQSNWCRVYTCVSGQSTPVPFWRCFQPSGLCLAPHC
jgi:curli biogenesis system outer membrane secretion channel CsgG